MCIYIYIYILDSIKYIVLYTFIHCIIFYYIKYIYIYIYIYVLRKNQMLQNNMAIHGFLRKMIYWVVSLCDLAPEIVVAHRERIVPFLA